MWCREEADIFIFLQLTIETRNSARADWAVVLLDGLAFPVHYELLSPYGPVAQLGEHLVCNQGVRGSNPLRSTNGPPFP